MLPLPNLDLLSHAEKDDLIRDLYTQLTVEELKERSVLHSSKLQFDNTHKLMPSLTVMDCQVTTLRYDEWIEVHESIVFSDYGINIDNKNQLILLKKIESFQFLYTRVTLLRVEGKLIKFDGKWRKTVWESGELPKPDNVVASIIDLTKEDYDYFCVEVTKKQIAELPSNEIIKLSYKAVGLTLTSERLRTGLITEALHIALRGRPRSLQDKRLAKEMQDINMFQAIPIFKNELLHLDRFNLKSDIFLTGVLAGILILLSINKVNIDQFINRLNEGRSEHKGEFKDPIASLLSIIEDHLANNRVAVAMANIALCKQTLQAALSWVEGPDSTRYWIKKKLLGTNHLPYVQELRRVKKIHARKDL